MVSQVYLDVVGSTDRVGWPPSYNGVIQRAWKRCSAEPFEMCVNPTTRNAARSPCKARFNLS